jgi:hypothetical protein
LTTGVNDIKDEITITVAGTRGKFATRVINVDPGKMRSQASNDTDSKFAVGINDDDGQFNAGVVDIGGAP